MRGLVLFVATVFLAQSGWGQSGVSADEPKIQAILKDGRTVIVVPIYNRLDRPVGADLALEWLDTSLLTGSKEIRNLTIQPGEVKIEVPFPLPENASIWLRLRYSLSADRSNPKAFFPSGGILGIAQIAPHIFELRLAHYGDARAGKPFTVQAVAAHPAGVRFVEKIKFTSHMESGGVEVPPSNAQINGGNAEFRWNIPADASGTATVAITAEAGDFRETQRLRLNLNEGNPTGRVQTDKPIYQPGQKLHLRGIVFGEDGAAKVDSKIDVTVDDPDGEKVHQAKLTTSRFGVVHDDWSIPSSAAPGEYRIKLELEDAGDTIAQHTVKISRYELPNFTVTAKTSKTAYLLNEPGSVEIRGTYLFGKPVPKGHVKIVRTQERRWNSKTRRLESDEELVTEGEADEDGSFTASLDLKENQESLREREQVRFEDLHYAVYFTDPGSGRTEQRRFDVRLTRQPIHVYILDPSRNPGDLPAPVYVTTNYADGTPAQTTAEVRWGDHLATVRTNRFGVGKAMLLPGDRTIEVNARDARGLTGSWTEQFHSYRSQHLLIETDKSIYRRNEAVRVRLTAAPDSVSDVVVTALAGDVPVASRIVHMLKGRGEVEFPNRSEFAGAVVFAAWNGGANEEDTGSKAVAFPDASDLQLTVVPEKGTYRPGENATVKMNVKAFNGQPVESVLGVAIVDQAVLERARTDQEFGHRPWFSCAFCASSQNVQIGGVSLNDLFHLDFSKALPEGLDLVAEALLSNALSRATLQGADSDRVGPRKVFSSLLDPIFSRVRTALDLDYQQSFDYPRDQGQLFSLLARQQGPVDLRDPWGTPFEPRFGVRRDRDALEFVSAGPDKRWGTADDFVVWEIQRPYFLPYEKLLREALAVEDYPATEDQLRQMLAGRGLNIEQLHDRWDTPYKTFVQTWGPNRHITLKSAGPDRRFDSPDDFDVFRMVGPYFRKERTAIDSALLSAASFPMTEADFRSVLRAAGIDLTQILDAWGNPYHVAIRTSMRYGDRRTGVAVRVYNGPLETRTDVTPVTQKVLTIELRSSGPDKDRGTYDDFTVATFSTVLNEESGTKEAQPAAKLPRLRAATGTITGTVSDPTGAVIPNAKVTLRLQGSETAYEALAGPEGVYSFISVPPGIYRLVFESPGFQREEVIAVPVTAGRTTVVDSRLNVGSVSETVEVQARAATELMACNASVSGIAMALATPRLREYFPETLLWAPEVETDAQGNAKLQFKLADNITTWKLAVIASTRDGRVVESEADLRAFQPFFIDHNPPPVLTSGDEIALPVTLRNYLDTEQKVAVKLQPNTWSEIRGASEQKLSLAPNSSANVIYPLRIRDANETARQRVTAIASKASDAIEKTIRVHPDGQETTQTLSDLVVGRTTLEFLVPPAAIRGATRAELRVSPSILSSLLEGTEGILQRPSGCAEQTTSTALANLIALRYAKAVHFEKPGFEERALENLAIARDRLYGFFEGGGGVSYWGRGTPDLAVSAHVLGFLVSAAKFVYVDEDRLQRLVEWIEKQQETDGRWTESPLTTALVARTLAAAQAAEVKVTPAALSRAYHHMAKAADLTAEPYAMALFVLAAIDSGDAELARSAAMSLQSMARDERGGLYWDLQTNTPFYGWGTSGRLETTALVVSALTAWRAAHSDDTRSEGLARKGIVFLLRHRDRYGVWHSTQATARAMQAIADASAVLSELGGKGGSIEIRVNGQLAKTVALPADLRFVDPILVDIGALLAHGENRVELIPTGSQNALVRLTSTHWTSWSATEARSSNALRLAVNYDRVEAAIGDVVRCRVRAERVGFRGYGMMLAEIGLPPGAEVDRASLEEALLASGYSINQYDVLPDRVIFYLWPRAGGVDFSFAFRARMAMRAKSAAFELYDYYNPEASAEVAPVLLVVR